MDRKSGLILILAGMLLAPSAAIADELALSTILNNLYGAGHYTQVAPDQFWSSDGTPTAGIAAVYAGAGQNLYTATPGSGSPVNPILTGIAGQQNASRFLGSSTTFTPVSQPFIFLDDTSPSGYQKAYSQDSLNSSGFQSQDRMMTFRVDGYLENGAYKSFSEPHYVVAFEDGSDFDYQDLVVETWGVKPASAPDGGTTFALLGAALAGLAALHRKLPF